MINYVITLGFGGIFFTAWCALCISKYKKWSNKRKKCKKQLSVQVIEILEKKTARGGMIYKPIFKTNENTNYIIDSAFYSSLVSFEIGQHIILLVNPQNPKDFLYKDNAYNKGIIVDVLCCCLPCIFLLGILLAIIL